MIAILGESLNLLQESPRFHQGRGRRCTMIASRLATVVHWLADLYLLSTVLLLVGMAIMNRLRKPSRRMAVARSVAAGLAALAILATAPGWPRIGAFNWQTADPAAASPTVAQPAVFAMVQARTAEPHPIGAEMAQPAGALAVVPPVVANLIEARNSRSGRNLPSWRLMIVAAFAVGAMANLAWLALGAIQAVRLRRSARVATPRLVPMVIRVARGLERAPLVCMSTRIGLPVAIGVVRPMIVLPDHFVASEPDDRLEAALAHEWAHIKNGDLRWLALLRLLNVVFYAQPLFWWLRRAIRSDQAVLADAAAALQGNGRIAYAETLIGWARSPVRPHTGALASAALALWERPSMLHSRVLLLLDRDCRVAPVTSRRWKVAAACIGLTGALLLSTVTLRPSAATAQQMEPRNGTKNPSGPVAQKAATTADRFEYAGRVLVPDGKPVAGAKLHLAYFGYSGQAPPAIRATSDRDGRFQFDVSKADFVESTDETPWTTAQVVATALGFGLGWTDASREQDPSVDPAHLTVRLAFDDAPIILVGLPRGRGNQFVAIPAKGQPYLAASVEIPDTPSLDPVSLDVGLTRGIVIEGRVTDRASGKPLKAFVEYNAYEDNPALAQAPGFRAARVWGQYQTEPDGSFRVVGLPGRGLVAAMYSGGGKEYLKGVGLPNVTSMGDTLPVVPNGMLGHFNALADNGRIWPADWSTTTAALEPTSTSFISTDAPDRSSPIPRGGSASTGWCPIDRSRSSLQQMQDSCRGRLPGI
jgi:beta-lactamase regulating signal transducer with metallopeptidase domain